MAGDKGFIRISRGIEDWEHSDSLTMIGFWVRLLLLANWKDTKKIRRGELVITAPALAGICGVSESSVRRYLKKLEDSGEIKMSTNHRSTKIRILNYEKYQSGQFDRTDDQTADRTDDQTADRTYLYEKKERRKEGKKEEKSLKEAKSFTPPTADEIREYAESKGLSLDVDAFIDYYEDKDWIVSGDKCRDWRYLVRSWCRKDKQFSKTSRKKKDAMPDWYDPDPRRQSSGETLTPEELKAAQEKLKRMKGGN